MSQNVKIILKEKNKEKEGEQKRLSAEIHYNKQKD